MTPCVTVGVYGREPREEILQIIEALQGPPYILLSDDGLDLSGVLAERYPAMQQIGRITYSTQVQDGWLHSGWDEWHLREWGKLLVRRISERAPAVSIFQGDNELKARTSTPTELRDACYIDLGVVAEAHRLGKKAMVGNIAEGNFLFGAGDLRALDGIAQAGDYFNYHAYTLYKTRALDLANRLYHELRWVAFSANWEMRGISPKYILGEALHEPGWRGWLSEDQLIDDWLQYLERIKGDSRVATVVGFQVGGDSQWDKYRLGLRWAQAMGNWNARNWTPDVPTPTPQPTLPNGGGEMPTKPVFLFGFKALAEELGAGVVGEPLEDQGPQNYDAFKNVQLFTSKGVMVYNERLNKAHFLPAALPKKA